jgi:hypothetical protein
LTEALLEIKIRFHLLFYKCYGIDIDEVGEIDLCHRRTSKLVNIYVMPSDRLGITINFILCKHELSNLGEKLFDCQDPFDLRRLAYDYKFSDKNQKCHQ